ncbi:DUF397 domain-containing protein [Sphaerisporangium corydalis]|uniref:DUF397 domain-containing protein n=1 Tax=Sphaerisporangium corydalis TaxID=1441875 RepID=A0ABV9E6H0_9ACTN|nr:DUF397 domain-containing protein [Sphaerisporangium corydalis]
MASDLRSARWRKSSFSADQGNCIEVTLSVPGVIGVRDSKDPSGAILALVPDEWSKFLTSIKSGNFPT